MQSKWVLNLGRILIILGIIVLIANFVFNYLAAVNGAESGFVTQMDALSFLLPGIILVGFNRVLNKLDELKGEKSVDDYNAHKNQRQKKERQIITSDEQLKDYKYVTRK